MKAHEARTLLNNLLCDAERACDIAKTAKRNQKSLAGANPYGQRFHSATVSITTGEVKVRTLLDGLDLRPADQDGFTRNLALLKSADSLTARQRADALKELRLLFESVILPKIESMTASPVPATEQVLPLAVVKGTRGYLEQVVTQANGNYEHQWYDACSVMIRKLVEILIIAVFEGKGEAAAIKKDDNFLMLSGLVDAILARTDWNLGRETKTALPLLKSLGDRSAHNRHFLARKVDVDKVLPGLRVTVEDLLHHANLVR
jgi:hypothetical protein